MKKKARAISWNTIPSPYSVDRFNAVADRGEIEFEAWFTDQTASDRSWEFDEREWRFKYRYLRHVDVLGRCVPLPPLSLLTNPPDVIASYYAGPVYLAGIAMAKLRRRKTAIWSMLTFESWSPRSWWKEAIKHLVYRTANGVFTVGPDSAQYATKYGASPHRIYLVEQAFDVDHFAARGKVDEASRRCRREALGLRGTVFVYVGRIWRGKGLDTLFDAYKRLATRVPGQTSLLIIGDGEDEEFYRRRCAEEGIPDVIFTGFVQKNDLPGYYALSDVSIFPTLGDPYGLVVDEALAASLPVISSDAAGEIHERIENHKNGFVYPVGDSEALYRHMEYLTTHADARARMASAALTSTAMRTPEKWALEFETAVAAVLQGRTG